MAQSLTVDQGSSVAGVHYIQDSGERVLMLVARDDSGRWKAQLSGRAFLFAEHFDELRDGKSRVLRWFHRAFPQHVCNPTCHLEGFGDLAED